jgi:type I restriction enzyme R subunit
MMEKYDIVSAYFHGIDYRDWQKLEGTELARLLQRAQNAVTADDETKDGFLKGCTELSKAFALVSPHKEANAIRSDLAFFRTVQSSIRKYTPSPRDAEEITETAIKQLISESIASEEMVDIFGKLGKEQPEISILSDEFLDDLQKMEYKNLAIEVLRKLLNDEIKTKMRKNVIQYRSFKEMLERTIAQYHNRALHSAEVIQRLVEIAREIRAVPGRGEALGLTDEEMAFYDAVAKGYKYVERSEQLKEIACELTATIKANLSIDWTDHENVKAKIRAAVKRLLKRRGFKPDEANILVLTIMEQAESLYEDWPEAA